MAYQKFDVSKLERLDDPERTEKIVPDVMWHALGDPNPDVIVDVGAGTGLFACRFAELAPQATVYAVDIAPVMVRWMFEHRPAALSGRLKPMMGAETTVPLGTGEADLVVMIALHHELRDPIASYREALRLLAIGGQLLVVDWLPGVVGGGPPDDIRATPQAISAILDAVGFAEIESHEGLSHHSLLTASKPVICAL